jgi:hypothetical protein
MSWKNDGSTETAAQFAVFGSFIVALVIWTDSHRFFSLALVWVILLSTVAIAMKVIINQARRDLKATSKEWNDERRKYLPGD